MLYFVFKEKPTDYTYMISAKFRFVERFCHAQFPMLSPCPINLRPSRVVPARRRSARRTPSSRAKRAKGVFQPLGFRRTLGLERPLHPESAQEPFQGAPRSLPSQAIARPGP